MAAVILGSPPQLARRQRQQCPGGILRGRVNLIHDFSHQGMASAGDILVYFHYLPRISDAVRECDLEETVDRT